jgi:hypothetical protein
VPAAIPTAIPKKRKPTSLVSLTAFLNRMIDMAPTRENALAMFEPMTIMMMDVIMEIRVRVCKKDWL